MGLEFIVCGHALTRQQIWELETNYPTKRLAQTLCEIFYGDGGSDPVDPRGLVQRHALQALNILDMSGDEEPDWESPLWRPPLDAAAALRRFAAAFREQDAEALRLLRHVLSLYTTSHTFEEIRLQIIRHADDAAEHCERLAAAAETAITFHGHF